MIRKQAPAKVAWTTKFIMFWVRHVQQATASLGELWHTPASSMLTLAVIGVGLSLPTGFYIALNNAADFTTSWQQENQLTVYLETSTSTEQVSQFQQQLQAMQSIAQVTHISKQQGLAEFKEKGGFSDVLSLLDENPLPEVLLVQPVSIDLSALQDLQQQLQALPLVDSVEVESEWLQRLDAILSLVRSISSLINLLLVAAVVLIISNTMRLNILDRRSEIEVMKLVGATNAFIRRPFLYSGFWFGLIGGLIAWVLCNLLLIWSEYALQQVGLLYQQDIYLRGLSVHEFLALLMVACGLGLVSSWWSVNRHVNEIEPS